ncbi:MAG: anthranilate synthase component I [Dehalococcoidia bacterium]|nr:anthranilate synthase component I [Dehalococcoidia bacterium]
MNSPQRKNNIIRLKPIFRELSADLETPVSVFLKLRNENPCFLLESVERGEQLGRYSFIGINPSMVIKAYEGSAEVITNSEAIIKKLGPPRQGPDILHLLKELLVQYQIVETPELPLFCGGAVGYLSYDMISFFEKVGLPSEDEMKLPLGVFLITDSMVIFDHVTQKMKIVSIMNDTGSSNDELEAQNKIDEIVEMLERPIAAAHFNGKGGNISENATEMTSNFSRDKYKEAVERIKEYIQSGDAFQVVLSQRLQSRTTAEPFSIYRALRMLNPSPYMFFLDFHDFQLIGSSPEMLVRLIDRQAETRPIAGTRPRGANPGEDSELISDLLSDPKERAEHTMLVDLGRNDIGRVCKFGTVNVPLYMTTEKYSHVIHIVSSVTGELKENHDAFSLMRACFPAGTVSGAPKVRAMEIIEELEMTRRGPYAGAVGYFGFNGNMDTCITIRTIVMKKDRVFLQAGAGIVADSDPEKEYQETLKKMEVLKEAVHMAEIKKVAQAG